MNKMIATDKCLRALANVLNWDIRVCPFCGKGPRQYDDYPNHENDCPVILADKIISW